MVWIHELSGLSGSQSLQCWGTLAILAHPSRSPSFCRVQGKLVMVGCYASNNHGAGYGLHNGGNLEVRNSRSYMDSVGVGGARGILHAEGVVVRHARDNGFEISSECQAVLRGCTSHDAGTMEKGSGLAASDEGTDVQAHDCEFVSAGVAVDSTLKLCCV